MKCKQGRCLLEKTITFIFLSLPNCLFIYLLTHLLPSFAITSQKLTSRRHARMNFMIIVLNIYSYPYKRPSIWNVDSKAQPAIST